MRLLLATAALLLGAVPAAVVITFLLSPLWSWIEARSGVESMGHSGPADWCFAAIYAVLALAVLTAVALRWRRRRAGSSGARSTRSR